MTTQHIIIKCPKCGTKRNGQEAKECPICREGDRRRPRMWDHDHPSKGKAQPSRKKQI